MGSALPQVPAAHVRVGDHPVQGMEQHHGTLQGWGTDKQSIHLVGSSKQLPTAGRGDTSGEEVLAPQHQDSHLEITVEVFHIAFLVLSRTDFTSQASPNKGNFNLLLVSTCCPHELRC